MRSATSYEKRHHINKSVRSFQGGAQKSQEVPAKADQVNPRGAPTGADPHI